MLKKVVKNKAKLAKGHRIAIVASRYNSKYVDSMLRAAKKELAQSQVSIEIVRVPGAFEIPENRADRADVCARDHGTSGDGTPGCGFHLVRR